MLMNTNEFNREMNDESNSRKLVRRTSAQRMLTGMALASGLTAAGWALDVPPVRWISNSVFAAAKSKDLQPAKREAKKDRTTDQNPQEKKIKLNYFSASWPRVLQDLASAGDMDVVADKYPVGRYSRMDRTEYTRKEALRIVNQELEQSGFRVVEKGEFLVLIELRTTRTEYPRPVLPKKTPAKPVDEVDEDVVERQRFRADSITSPQRDSVTNSVYTEDVGDRSIRYTNAKSRRSTDDSESDSERMPIARQSRKPQSVRQASNEEQGDGSERQVRGRTHLIETSAPAVLADVGAPAPPAVYRPRQLRAVELSKRVYRALKSSSELIDSGRNGLPAVSIVSPQFKSPNPATQQSGSSRSVEFMISIDEARNELLIDGRERDIAAATKLLRVMDRADEIQSKTVIKTGSDYVCQIADQLPAEIERIRAARGSDVSRHPVERNAMTAERPSERQRMRSCEPARKCRATNRRTIGRGT